VHAIVLKKLVCGSVIDANIVKKENAEVWLRMPQLTSNAMLEAWVYALKEHPPIV